MCWKKLHSTSCTTSKTDSCMVPASKNINAFTVLQGDCRKLAGPGFFSQQPTHTCAEAPSVTPCSVCIDPQLLTGTLQIMPVIGALDSGSICWGASAWSHSQHKEAGTSQDPGRATDGKGGRRNRIKAVSLCFLRGCQNRYWQQVAIGTWG